MKAWLLSICGLIIFIILSSLVQFRIQDNSKRFDKEIAKIEDNLVKKNWQKTYTKLYVLKTKWEKTKPLWAMLLHHQEIDSIDQSLIRSLRAIKSKNFTQSQIELGSLQHYIQHIPEREKFSLVNVF